MEAVAGIAQIFGARVRALRLAKGWQLDDLGKHLGKSRASVSRIENGKQNLTMIDIAMIATALQVSVPVLFGGFQFEEVPYSLREYSRQENCTSRASPVFTCALGYV